MEPCCGPRTARVQKSETRRTGGARLKRERERQETKSDNTQVNAAVVFFLSANGRICPFVVRVDFYTASAPDRRVDDDKAETSSSKKQAVVVVFVVVVVFSRIRICLLKQGLA